jgi:GNAT superfamily N-acetyltransferase
MDATRSATQGLAVRRVTGEAIAAYLDDVARLRISVFRDWPYLYAGDQGYERDYLGRYARSRHAVFVLAFDGDRVVGASTGLPLADEAPAFRAPFAERGIDQDAVFYCGESVLLPGYRGRGVGHAFFDHREAHARALGLRWSAFCTVERPSDDPRRPRGHRPNDAFWRKRGYRPQPGMRMELSWDEVGAGETAHTLVFWLRELVPTVR